MNANHIAEKIENDVEIRAFVDVEEEMLEEIEDDLGSIDGVESVQFIPKEEAIEQFIDSVGEDGHLFEDLREDENPLPDTFIIQTHDPQATSQVAEEVDKVDSVYRVNYGGETTERLFRMTNMLRNIGIVFIVGLAFTAMFLIANTIKITIAARGTEIEIMKLVGASNSFVRWPFFLEGLLLGLIGAIIPSLLLIIGYYEVLKRTYSPFIQLVPIYPLSLQISVLLIVIGAFIGVWGSIVSVRKYLRV
jgi:cell division transport system permease protein